jgi:hypothetical protein
VRTDEGPFGGTVMPKPLTLSRTIAVACIVLLAASCGGTVASNAPADAVSGPPSTAASGTSPAASASASGAADSPTLRWPAPPDPMVRTIEAGLVPAPKEFLINHVHSHLDVFVDGQPILVPAGIGIKIDDPHVRHFEDPLAYGGIDMCAEPCISPLHTHDESGVLHTESIVPEPHTLGQFFTEWGVALTETCVGEECSKPIAVYIAGEPYEGDPRAIEITDQRVIVIVVGTPPVVIPSTADFSEA